MLFLALQEMANAAGQPAEAAQWGSAAAALGGYHTNGEGALKLDSVHDLTYSHRHLANLIGLYPFNLLSVDGGDNETNTIAASLRQWDNLGTSGWVGYSFVWMSCLRARVGQAESALRNLDVFTKAFILRNGFHANGDQTGSGFSDFTYRPFTLEGNFLAMQAIHEMLLQSWNNTPGSGTRASSSSSRPRAGAGTTPLSQTSAPKAVTRFLPYARTMRRPGSAS